MRQRGFTLIELLLAVALLAIMSGVTFGGLIQVKRIAAATESNVAKFDSLERAFYWLQEDFEQVVNRDVVDELGGKNKSIEVSQAGEYLIQITRGGWTNPAMLQMPPRSDLQRVAYLINDESKLMRRYWYHVDRFDANAYRDRQLLEDANGLTFRFFDARGKWHTTWPPEDNVEEDFNEMPAAVEATIDVEGVGSVNRIFVLPF